MVQGAHTVLDGLQFAAQDRQRRAQFVGDIGHKFAAHFFVALKGVGQLIEVAGQLADFVIGRYGYPVAVFPGGQFVGGSGHALDRIEQGAGNPPGNQHGQQQRHKTHRQAGLQLVLLEA